ncbi:MAG TPA: PAS domain S-box protein [Rhizobiaceae bacterium]|nr:PAS domain S-box protein [Rhizobiaceae bacterium]
MRALHYFQRLLKQGGELFLRHVNKNSVFGWVALPLFLTAVATVAQLAIFSRSDSGHTYAILYFAVATSALLGGYRGGLVASVAATTSALLLFHPLDSVPRLVVLAIFVVNCALVIGVCHAISVISLRAAEAQAEAHRAVRLLKSEQLFRLFIEHAPAALALFDKNLRCLAASRRWIDNYGVGEEQFDDAAADLAGGMPLDWSEALRKALAGEISRKEEDLIIHPGGQEQWLRWEVRPWRDAAGSVGGVVVFSEDITPQKGAAIALAESELRLRATIESVEYAMIVTDRRGQIESMNSATSMLFGYSETELLGRNIDLIVIGHRANEVETVVGGGVFDGNHDMQGKRKDKSTFPIDYMATEWNDMHGELHRTVTIYDISERRAVEEELARAGRMEAVGRLAGGIAHDFGNLLSIIIGNLELVEPHIVQGKPRVMVGKALEAAVRGAGFTRQLLTLARKRQSEFEKVDLNQHVSGMVVLFEHALGGNVRLNVNLASDLWMTWADPAEVDSAIINLVMNARHAMPNGGAMHIETRNVTLAEKRDRAGAPKMSGEFVQISVRDSGTGMTKDVRRHAFDPFFTTSKDGEGSGLGLPSVYAFAQACGGFVTLDSSMGKGTAVNIYIPRISTGERTTIKPATSLCKRGHGEVILVVEDNKGVREVSVERLERLGYITRAAESFAEACQILREDSRIVLVFSDIVLTGSKTGYDIARWVGRNRPGVKVLLTTSYDVGDKQGAKDISTRRFRKLSKPYSATRLADEIRRSLDADPLP